MDRFGGVVMVFAGLGIGASIIAMLISEKARQLRWAKALLAFVVLFFAGFITVAGNASFDASSSRANNSRAAQEERVVLSASWAASRQDSRSVGASNDRISMAAAKASVSADAAEKASSAVTSASAGGTAAVKIAATEAEKTGAKKGNPVATLGGWVFVIGLIMAIVSPIGLLIAEGDLARLLARSLGWGVFLAIVGVVMLGGAMLSEFRAVFKDSPKTAAASTTTAWTFPTTRATTAKTTTTATTVATAETTAEATETTTFEAATEPTAESSTAFEPSSAPTEASEPAGEPIGMRYDEESDAWVPVYAETDDPPPIASDVVVVTAEDLLDDFKNNELRAGKKYTGKTLEVTGIVKRVDSQFVAAGIGYEYILELEGGAWDFFSTLDCYGIDNDALAELDKGYEVTVFGVCADGRPLHVTMRRCEIVSFTPNE